MFNISQFKNRNQSDVWINLVGQDGKSALWLKGMTKEQAKALKSEIEQFHAGTYEGNALDEFKSPIRLKIKSPHSQAFNKARMVRKVKDSMLIQGMAKDVKSSIDSGEELDPEALVNLATSKVCDTVTSGIAMICELAVDWDGFNDGTSPVEFDVEILQAFLMEPDNINTYTDIIKKIDGKTDFFTE